MQHRYLSTRLLRAVPTLDYLKLQLQEAHRPQVSGYTHGMRKSCTSWLYGAEKISGPTPASANDADSTRHEHSAGYLETLSAMPFGLDWPPACVFHPALIPRLLVQL